ncbi:MAG: SDR family oxidoreductase [Sphingomonadales bacterium]|nr:SDR family oxidoreductase [Sphingomonadales bacterium]
MALEGLPQGIAVVTGAAGGMGSACARQLADAGWDNLLLCDVSSERLEAVAGPLRAAGHAVDRLAGDVADPAFPARVMTMLAGAPIAALVHTAGISPAQGDARRIIDVNLDATARLVDAARDHMAPGSAAILFASNSSYFPMPPEAAAAFTAPLPPAGAVSLVHFAPQPELAYPLSKLGVRALVKREAKAFGARGVRIASISPGAIDTPMTQGASFQMAQRMVDASASGRMGRPDELAAVAVFMCSPAAGFVTAVDWLVDGGHTAGMGL